MNTSGDWVGVVVTKAPGNNYQLERSSDLITWGIQDDSQHVWWPGFSSWQLRQLAPDKEFYRFRFPGPAKVLFFTSFEDSDANQSNLAEQFNFDRDAVGAVDVFGTPLHTAFTGWNQSTNAKTGTVAVNCVPNGNPVTGGSSVVSGAILRNPLSVSGLEKVRLLFWTKSTSNPRIASVHNCDSGLNVYIRRDSQPWTQLGNLCGEHKSESHGWRSIFLEIDPLGASQLALAFLYELQNNPATDGEVVYLLDDLAILGE